MDIKFRIKYRYVLLSIILLFSVVIVFLSFNRFFNFDEFNGIYISSFFMRGDNLYNSKGISHFPLRALINSTHVALFGKTSLQLLYGRITSLIFLFITAVFTFKIVNSFRDRTVSLGSVLLLITSYVFIEKGIEIRNDVFNMAFCTVSVYFLLRFLKESKNKYFYISGLFGGIALAATQKSIVWLVGICFGLFLYLIFNKKTKRAFQRSISYFVMVFIPVLLIFAVLIVFFGNNPFHIFKNTVLNRVSYILPHAVEQSGIPFPHSRWDMWENIIKQDFMLFILIVPSLIFLLLRIFKQKERRDSIILFGWFITGFVFYLIMKRPFHQSFLPTMPSIVIIVTVFISYLAEKIGKRFRINNHLVFLVVIIFIIFTPVYSWARFAGKVNAEKDTKRFLFSLNNSKQLDNASFCVNNLGIDDKVVCFTHQQLFFDPVFYFFKKNINGLNLHQIPPSYFQKRVKEEECKVMILDHRTKLLNPKIFDLLRDMYVYSGVGDVFVPGIRIDKERKDVYHVFVPGLYRIINGPVMINGKTKNNYVYLSKERLEINNTQPKKVLLIKSFK